MVRIVVKILNYTIVTLIVLLVLVMAGMKFMGIHMYTVLSGSMEPEYPVGSLIFVKETPAEELAVDDVITFRLAGEVTATHRIVEILPDDGLSFITKGDANDGPDNSHVVSGDVIGKVVYQIKKGGYFVDYVQRPPGKYLFIGIAGFLFLFVFISDMFIDDKKEKKTQSDEKTKS